MEMVQALKFPARFDARQSYYETGSCVMVLSRDASRELYDEFKQLNPPLASKFVFMNGSLYVEGLTEGESASIVILTAGLDYLGTARVNYNNSLQQAYPHLPWNTLTLTGQAEHSNANFGACPDFSLRLFNRTSPFANLVVHIAYSVSLAISHEKILAYMNRCPGIMSAMIFDIHYPWQSTATMEGVKTYNPQDGKIVCYYYDRYINRGLIPSYAISFGNAVLTAKDIDAAKDITGIEEGAIRGFGIEDTPPCSARGIEVYQAPVSGRVLFTNDPNDQDIITATGHLLTQLPESFDLTFDLFLFKECIVAQLR